ncbi:MAG: uracil-DNA glycosylase, partial [Hyphomicrobiales bacterium]|nr:uracil-DNA glycosylase [Hyphomicrobiales bacterium]
MNGTEGGLRQAAQDLLEWYAEAGVDAFLADTPQDRFAESAVKPAPTLPQAAAPAPQPTRPQRLQSPPPTTAITGRAQMPTDESVLAARERAAAAASLDDLRQALAGFEGCAL